MDYKKLNLKAGLEIHQQLDTNKLFCSCPSLLRQDSPDFKIKRKLHKVAGETGEIDTAVEYESSLNKEFIYEGYNDTTCLVELDESPPQQLNQEALEIALQIALLLNCEIYPASQIMRKTVINGSNTSGFQRTVLIAHNGFIKTSFGKVKIETIALEEDAARIIDKNNSSATYRLDRLGIPLVEIVTSPDMSTPEQIKETALKLGEILRACKVKRGIGTIRQDVNISTKGHPRVEIKGFQEPRIMIKTVELEIERQQSEKEKISSVRNSLPEATTKFLRPMPSQARMYPETDLPLLKISRDLINKVKKSLPKLKHEIKSELKKKGLSDELIYLITSSVDLIDEFETLLKIYPKNPDLIAKMQTLWPNEIAKKKKISPEKVREILSERVLEEILKKLKEKSIAESDIKKIIEDVISKTNVEHKIVLSDVLSLIDSLSKIEKLSSDEIEEEIRKIIKEKPGMRPNAYMGLIMSNPKLKGKLNPQEAMQIINKILNQ